MCPCLTPLATIYATVQSPSTILVRIRQGKGHCTRAYDRLANALRIAQNYPGTPGFAPFAREWEMTQRAGLVPLGVAARRSGGDSYTPSGALVSVY